VSDVVTFAEDGRTYRVAGLQAKAEAIGRAAQEMDTLIEDRVRAAGRALEEWQGAHAATFVEDGNGVLSQMASLRVKLWHASRMLSAFPEAPTASIGTMRYVDAIYMGARLDPPSANGAASAVPGDLRAYMTVSSGQDCRFASLADAVNLDGVTAEVSYERALTPGERQRQIDAGATPAEADEMTTTHTEPVADLEALIPLPSPRPMVPALVAASRALGEFASAVAIAFENADRPLLDLLADYPGLAGFIVAGMGDGRVSGESSLAILLAYFAEFDTAAHGGDADGIVSLEDLEAVTGRTGLPEHVRAAARYLLDNPTLFGLAETMHDSWDPNGADILGGGDGRISEEDIRAFLELNAHLRTLEQDFDTFDTAAHGGDADGIVSRNDLEAIAAGSGPLATTAQYLLDNDTAYRRLANYEQAKEFNGVYAAQYPQFEITRNSVIGLAVDQQVYGDDAEAARRFVTSLPVASDGDEGIPIWLCSDDGTKSLANAALLDTLGDLSDAHTVISHLPETTTGVRNRLITGFYDELARRADALFAGPLAGDPAQPGHPGVNWLLMAPWASNTAGGAIRGDLSVWGMGLTGGERQAMADGNQWIFNDIGARYAAFIELYEANPNPSESELESFFATTFRDGDAQIRTGFAGYVAVMEESDPAARQQLMFEANTLVAMHEQAGVQPYLEKLDRWYVPKEIERRYFDTSIAGQRYDLDLDVPETNLPNNVVDDAPLLDLDPGGRTPASYQASTQGATEFSDGGTPRSGVVDMPPISGIESRDDEFPTSTRQMWEEGSGGASPDSTEGSGASSWQDRNERMYYIVTLFEQNHSSPDLYQTERFPIPLSEVRWLDPATGLR
jgi:hypothetical protein